MLKHLLVTLAASTVVIATPNELIFQNNLSRFVNKIEHNDNWIETLDEVIFSVLQPEKSDVVQESSLENIKDVTEKPLKLDEDKDIIDGKKPIEKEENTTPPVVITHPPVSNATKTTSQATRQERPAETQPQTPQPIPAQPIPAQPIPAQPIPPSAPEATASAVPSSNQQENTVTASTPADTFELEVLRLTNIERVNVGLRPLRYNTSLEEGAKIRSEEIIEHFSHTRPDGSRFFTVFGPNFKFRNVGENLASGFRTPAQVVTAWMNSASHRANILNPNFEELAVASTRGEDGRVRWVQIFYRAP